jgi:acyl-CoA synthetase (AMP-forming)/AMP-acid ligase II
MLNTRGGHVTEQVYSTLVETLRDQAVQRPDVQGFSFLRDGEVEEASLTYAALDTRAQAIGAWLTSISANRERVILLYPMGLEFVCAFLGCLYAGAIAVPAHMLDTDALQRSLSRLSSIVQDAQPRVILTTTIALDLIDSFIPGKSEAQGIPWMATDVIPDELSAEWKHPNINSETLALLQYTSGSTSAPKGVMVSHRNLLWRASQEKGTSWRDLARLSWRPLVNTGGLYMGVVLPLVAGSPSVLMSPDAFLRKPIRWLRTISHYKVALSGGPNFAYELSVVRTSPEERNGLDLKSWKSAFVVAEHINPEILQRFADTFEPYGFQREAFTPRYGLTEMTGLISLTPANRGLRVLHLERAALQENKVITNPERTDATIDLVSTGTIVSGNVVIVNPDPKTRCKDDQIGEIWAWDKDAPRGYWNKAAETERTFNAYLADTHEGPFLRTGDLGFIQDGELFVTGRLKDLIIVRGRNIYPQDIEATVEECYPNLRPGSTVVFSIPSDTDERIVIVQELHKYERNELNQITETIREAVFDEHEVLAYAIVLVKAGTIPRSEPGKPQRGACRASFTAGKLDSIKTDVVTGDYGSYDKRGPFAAPRTTTEQKVAEVWRAVLELQRVGIYDNFVHLGGHSILATQCINRLRQMFGVDLPLSTLFSDTANVRELAETIDKLSLYNSDGRRKELRSS